MKAVASTARRDSINCKELTFPTALERSTSEPGPGGGSRHPAGRLHQEAVGAPLSVTPADSWNPQPRPSPLDRPPEPRGPTGVGQY